MYPARCLPTKNYRRRRQREKVHFNQTTEGTTKGKEEREQMEMQSELPSLKAR